MSPLPNSKTPPHKKLIPHRGIFFLVGNQEAQEALARAFYPELRRDLEHQEAAGQVSAGEPLEIWVVHLPREDVFNVQVFFMRGKFQAERYTTLSEMDALCATLPEPKEPDCLDVETWAAENLAEIDRLSAEHAAEQSSWGADDPHAKRVRGVADALLKRLGETRRLLDHYRDSQVSFQEHCARAANKYADERNVAHRHLHQALEDAQATRARAEEMEARELRAQVRLSEAHRQIRLARGEQNLVRFCKLLPEPGTRIDRLPQGAVWNILAAQVSNPALVAWIENIRVEDVGVGANSRVRVEYTSHKTSYSIYFTARQVEGFLEDAERAHAN